ncbi:hypothetical protein KDA_62460 [Dictyobacter alpinus]|uniref:Uncharacterized protein n=1 Tax=Dictyobacter alpinus TaxID=2014873 RepID=A0A402BHP7_9CHLR|nr:hypothetical protein KDA_62460 [Dictyobacter alpinus]
MEIMYFLVAIILLDLAALRWGIDSRDKIDSIEWTRRNPNCY